MNFSVAMLMVKTSVVNNVLKHKTYNELDKVPQLASFKLDWF